MSIILWIDPWTTRIWFAILNKLDNNKIDLIDYWVFSTNPKIELSLKLLEIWNDMSFILNKYTPNIVVVEKLYFQTNLKTWIDVAQARGLIIYLSSKIANAKILEYTPLQVKKAITLNWQANKLQVQNAIKIIFWLDSLPKPDDAADAIGLAYMGALKNF